MQKWVGYVCILALSVCSPVDAVDSCPSITGKKESLSLTSPHPALADTVVLANGIPIKTYPLDEIKIALDLNPKFIDGIREKSILLLGEGDGHLLPFFLNHNLTNIRAVDIWYHNETFPKGKRGKELRQFNRKYSRYLIRASALDLPFESNSVDFIFSFKLLNNLTFEQSYKALSEAFRVLKTGGEARIDAHRSDTQDLLNKLQEKHKTEAEFRVVEGFLYGLRNAVIQIKKYKLELKD